MDSIEFHNLLVYANIFQEMELEKNTRYEWNKHRPPAILHSLCLSQFSDSVRQKADEVLLHVELKLYSLFVFSLLQEGHYYEDQNDVLDLLETYTAPNKINSSSK